MAITKLSSGPYAIHTINYGDPITLDAANVIIKGNLDVRGAVSTIETTNVIVYDNIITLNAGASSPGMNAGILINRGPTSNTPAFQWTENLNRWQITIDGTTYANVLTSTGTGTGLSQLSEDLTPTLGGNLNVANYTVFANVGNMNFTGNLQFNYPSTIPSVSSNATVLYSSISGAGLAGLYVVNDQVANEELITKRRAIAYSILF